MTAYYNEIDPSAAAWLRELISRGQIAPGDVDERSIEDVCANDLRGYTQCHFFAGIGLWSYALRLAGWPDDRPVWTGSCPCQPFSAAGKGAGFADERHLWPAFCHLISVCGPELVFGEQVAGKDGLGWLDLVSADLEALGYACGAVPFPAAGIGAPHIRERLYWVGERLGHPGSSGLEKRERLAGIFDRPIGAPARQASERASLHAGGSDLQPGPNDGFWRDADWLGCRDGKWRPVEPGTFPLAHGSAQRVGRLRGYGNGLVAPQAATFIEVYIDVRAA